VNGLFLTFEGTEGGGKTTQMDHLCRRLTAAGRVVRSLREPGGTPVGEEIRHLLKHSDNNRRMVPEAELLLMNASRAQLVRELIRPALAAGECVLCDRFFDSSIAYQGYGRGLDLAAVRSMIDYAVGLTRPDLTFWLHVPRTVSEERRRLRAGTQVQRDRFEEADAAFFDRVEEGFVALAAAEPRRIRRIDATAPVETVAAEIWNQVEPLLNGPTATGGAS